MMKIKEVLAAVKVRLYPTKEQEQLLWSLRSSGAFAD